MPERFREKLSPLLDESRSSGDIIGEEIKIFQKFVVDAAALQVEEEMDHLAKAQFLVTSKILFGVFDKVGSATGHVVHDCPESGRTFWVLCQPLF